MNEKRKEKAKQVFFKLVCLNGKWGSIHLDILLSRVYRIAQFDAFRSIAYLYLIIRIVHFLIIRVSFFTVEIGTLSKILRFEISTTKGVEIFFSLLFNFEIRCYLFKLQFVYDWLLITIKKSQRVVWLINSGKSYRWRRIGQGEILYGKIHNKRRQARRGGGG